MRNDPAPVREIRKSSLPTPLEYLLETVRRETESEITLWDITTELGIPVVLCSLQRDKDGRRYFGSGASLSRGYAVERAILEAVQSYHIHRVYETPLPRSLARSITMMSRYQRCYLDAGHFEYRGGAAYVDYDEMAQPAADPVVPNSDAQIALINRLLKACDFHAYARSISTDTVSVVQVVVPKLERFHLVSYGLAVAPSTRGRRVLEC